MFVNKKETRSSTGVIIVIVVVIGIVVVGSVSSESVYSVFPEPLESGVEFISLLLLLRLLSHGPVHPLEHVHSCQSDQIVERGGGLCSTVDLGLSGVLDTGDHPHVFDLLTVLFQGSLIDADDLVDVQQLKQAVLACLGGYLGATEDGEEGLVNLHLLLALREQLSD